MGRHLIETVMGAVVLLVAAGFLVFAYNQSNVKSIDGYAVNAKFDDVTGVTTGSEVRIGGMKVGVVERLDLDPDTYQAIAVMQIRDGVKLPKDTSAAVVSSGLLGDKFIKLAPGGDDAMFESGDTIRFTQSSVSFEELLGKFVFSSGGVEGEDAPQSAPSTPATDAPSEDKNPFSLELE
jgi:phospholipid/cholesterol/gamma-HCH transport system substrate-binding protein